MLDALADEFGGELPGVDYELDPGVSDLEMAQGLSVSGVHLLSGLVSSPPTATTKKSRAEQRLLHRAVQTHLDRSLAAVRFLTHSVIDFQLVEDELGSELSERLDFQTVPPRPVEYRAQRALREHLPIGDTEAVVLGDASADVLGVREVASNSDTDVQGALGFRLNGAKRTVAVHAIKMLLLDEFQASRTARDNSGYSNLVGDITMSYVWRPAEQRALETLSAVGLNSNTGGDSIVTQLLLAALKKQDDRSWEWDLTAGEAVVLTADKLSQHQEDYNLVLDAIALGYWVRHEERDVTGDVVVADPNYQRQARSKYDDDDPKEAVRLIMAQIALDMPGAFALGPGVWADMLHNALLVLGERGRVILAGDEAFDQEVALDRERAELAFGLGYGLGVTKEILDIPCTQPRGTS